MDADTPAEIQAGLNAAKWRDRPAPPAAPAGAFTPPAAVRPVRVGRATIDDALLAHDPAAGPTTLQAVQAAPLVQRAALALDQVAHRTDAALAEHGGRLPRDVARANGDDMAVADRLLQEAATVHAVVGRMVETMRGRLAAVGPGGDPSRRNDAMDRKEYEAQASGHAGPADAPPDSPHGGLGKGKQEGIEHALAGEPVADRPVNEGVVRAAEDDRATPGPEPEPEPKKKKK